MKFSMMMAVFAAAFCVAGCKYDKAARSGSGVDDASGSNIATDASLAEEGSLSDAVEPKFDELYAKCTDVDFEPVYFGFDSTVVPQGELGKIDAVAQHLTAKTDRVVVVEGNCDERGSSEYNLSLGENRAIVVRNYLINNGIADSRIQIRSYGEEKPAVEGQNESAWAKNRRDEFGIYDTTQKK